MLARLAHLSRDLGAGPVGKWSLALEDPPEEIRSSALYFMHVPPGIHGWRVPRPDLCWGSGWGPLIRISSYRDGTTQEAQKGFSVFQGRLSSLDELCELCDSCWHSRAPQPGERASDAAPPATGPAAPAPSQESIHATPPKSKSTILCQPLLSL